MLTRVADQVGELVGDWTPKALEGVLEAYHGIAAIEERWRAEGSSCASARRRGAGRRRGGERSTQRCSARAAIRSRDAAQLLLRTAALGTLRDAYYREVIAIKRRMIEAGAASTVGDPPLFEPRLQLTGPDAARPPSDSSSTPTPPLEGLGLNPTPRRRRRRRAPPPRPPPRAHSRAQAATAAAARRRRRGRRRRVSVGAHLGLAVDARLEGGLARRLDRHVARPRCLPPPRHLPLVAVGVADVAHRSISNIHVARRRRRRARRARRRCAAAAPGSRRRCCCRRRRKRRSRLELPWLEHEYSLYHYYTSRRRTRAPRLQPHPRARGEVGGGAPGARGGAEGAQDAAAAPPQARRRRGRARHRRPDDDGGAHRRRDADRQHAAVDTQREHADRRLEAPPPPPPEAEAPAAAPAAEEMPGALSERLRTAQETLASLASTLSEGEIEAWLEQMVSTRGTLMDDAVAGDKIEKCVRPNLDDLVPVVKREEITSIAQLLRKHFEELKLIYRYYCTHRVVDASLAFALSEVQWLAFCDDCESPTSAATRSTHASSFSARTPRAPPSSRTRWRAGLAGDRRPPAEQPSSTCASSWGARPRRPRGEPRRRALWCHGGWRRSRAPLPSRSCCPSARCREKTADELRLQMARTASATSRCHAGALQRVYRYYRRWTAGRRGGRRPRQDAQLLRVDGAAPGACLRAPAPARLSPLVDHGLRDGRPAGGGDLRASERRRMERAPPPRSS